MLFHIPVIEWIGFVGSVIVAVSLTMNSIRKLRWYNLFGAAVFSAYGFAIGALPVGLLNLFIVLVNVYYLQRLYSAKAAFKSILIEINDPYLDYFLDFHQEEIKEFFPHFDKENIKDTDESKTTFVLLLLKNAVVTGAFIGVKNNHRLYVHLDFVTLEYRDLQPGDFIYNKNNQMMKDAGIEQIICMTENKGHMKYLRNMGFESQQGNVKNVYLKNI